MSRSSPRFGIRLRSGLSGSLQLSSFRSRPTFGTCRPSFRRNTEATNRTVVCADAAHPPAVTTILAGRARLRALDPQPITTGLEADVCAFWPMNHHTDPPPAPRPQVGSHLLLVAGTHDPVTPIADALRRQQQWARSGLISSTDTWSHGVFASQHLPCVDDAVADFLLGSVATSRHCPGSGLPR